MFRWYQNSKVCYVYLEDIRLPSAELLNSNVFHIWLRTSRWFTRGWTLQELIAPAKLIFFDLKWMVLGTKETMVDILSSITRIDKTFFLSTDRFWYLRDDGPCIAQIMSWAADRKTTRVEDKAYCLLGLFDINMPLLYGEGKKAFFRLQEELIKCSNDASLFAWGVPQTVRQLDIDGENVLDENFNDIYNIWEIDQADISTTGLLARSPEEFRHSGNIRRRNLGMASILKVPPATVNRGIRLEMCCPTSQNLLKNIRDHSYGYSKAVRTAI